MAKFWALFLLAMFVVILHETDAACSDHGKCGCYRGWCWKFANWERMAGGSPWCYAQRLGVPSGKKSFASCLENDDCHIEMNCGDSETHTGAPENRPAFA